MSQRKQLGTDTLMTAGIILWLATVALVAVRSDIVSGLIFGTIVFWIIIVPLLAWGGGILAGIADWLKQVFKG